MWDAEGVALVAVAPPVAATALDSTWVAGPLEPAAPLGAAVPLRAVADCFAGVALTAEFFATVLGTPAVPDCFAEPGVGAELEVAPRLDVFAGAVDPSTTVGGSAESALAAAAGSAVALADTPPACPCTCPCETCDLSRDKVSIHHTVPMSPIPTNTTTAGITSLPGSLVGRAREMRVRSGCACAAPVGVGIQLLQLRGRLADELRIVTQVAAGIHRGAERGEVLGLQGLENFRVHVQLLGRLQNGETFTLAGTPQPRANTGAYVAACFHRHDAQPGLRSRLASARVWSELGKSNRSLRA